MKRLFSAPIIKWLRNLLRNSKYRWLIILGSVIYLVSPLDISPDIFPVLGWIDDGLLATIVVTELTQMAADRRRKRVQQAEQSVDSQAYGNVIDIEAVSAN
ncbi:MAG: YkvA family protein [Cyanobacteria bacterium P01_F01_bin.56]